MSNKMNVATEHFVYWDSYGYTYRGVLADLSSAGYVKMAKVSTQSDTDTGWDDCTGTYIIAESILRDKL